MVSIMEKVEKEIKIKRRKRFLSIETNVPISWLFLDLLFLSFSLFFFGCKSFHFLAFLYFFTQSASLYYFFKHF